MWHGYNLLHFNSPSSASPIHPLEVFRLPLNSCITCINTVNHLLFPSSKGCGTMCRMRFQMLFLYSDSSRTFSTHQIFHWSFHSYWKGAWRRIFRSCLLTLQDSVLFQAPTNIQHQTKGILQAGAQSYWHCPDENVLCPLTMMMSNIIKTSDASILIPTGCWLVASWLSIHSSGRFTALEHGSSE